MMHGPGTSIRTAAQVAERPPAPEKVLAFGCGISGRQKFLPPHKLSKRRSRSAFDLLASRLEHAQDVYQPPRRALAADTFAMT